MYKNYHTCTFKSGTKLISTYIYEVYKSVYRPNLFFFLHCVILAWDMVFKAVQGVVPLQGGLRQLWTSSDTLNSDNPSAQTLTRSPNLVYKSANVEKWQSIPGFFIESVRWRFCFCFCFYISFIFFWFYNLTWDGDTMLHPVKILFIWVVTSF